MLNARKQAANLLEEGTRPERLSEQWTRHIPVRGNAGDEQYRKCRLEAGKAAGEFQAVHNWQQNVSHDKAELLVQRAGDGQGLFPVLRREDSEALLSQRLRQDTAEHWVVLHNQHRLLTQLPGSHEIFCSGEPAGALSSWTAQKYQSHSHRR